MSLVEGLLGGWSGILIAGETDRSESLGLTDEMLVSSLWIKMSRRNGGCLGSRRGMCGSPLDQICQWQRAVVNNNKEIGGGDVLSRPLSEVRE